MKDYRDMLSSLKDKVVDAAGKAVSDEVRDKVAGAAPWASAPSTPRA